MQKLLQRFTQIDNPNNVLLIPLPTGVGKTYNVMSFIADLVASGDKRKVYYVTPLKKNLESAKKDLFDMLNDYGINPESVILSIDSICNYLIKNYVSLCRSNRGLKNDIRMCFSDPKTFDDFDSKIECLKELEDSEKKGNKVPVMLLDKFRMDVIEAERKMRRTIHTMFPRVEPEEKMGIIESNSKWYWIPLLYPSVYTMRRQVYFLSVDKFISVHDPIVDRAYKFYESATLNDSIVVFDEFDSCKDSMLKHIIGDSLARIDYLGMFKTIALALRDRQNTFIDYYKDSEATVSSKGEGYLKKMIEELAEYSETICKEFNLDWSFKSQDRALGNYIFHDFKSQTVGKTGEFKILADKNRKVHDVLFEKNTYKTDFAITTLFSQLYGFFRKFEGVIRAQADNYIEIKKAEGKTIPRDAALNTMLVPYRLDSVQTDYVLGTIRLMTRTKRTDSTRGYDASIYNTGISYYDFEDDVSHDLSTTIYSSVFNITPEKIILKVLERGGVKVIGVSATAKLDSSVGNFHLYYLRHRAEWQEEIISEDEWKDLKNMCNKSIFGYSNVNLVTKIVNGAEEGWFSSDSEQGTLFHNEDIYSHVKMRLINTSDYARSRYLKLGMAYKWFLLNEDMQSFIAFFSKSIKKAEKEVDQNNPFTFEDVDLITRSIAEELGKPIHPGSFGFEILSGKNEAEFETVMNDFRERLYHGERLFLITTYATVGAGQNLQYSVPSTDGLVQINDFKHGSNLTSSIPANRIMRYNIKKDIDGIYLNEPTMIVPSVKKGDEESLVRALFVIEFLMEGNEVSEQDARQAIRNAFRSFNEPIKYTIPTKSTRSIRMAYARHIIQAVGRICRTNLKNRNIYLMADANLKNVFVEDIEAYGKLRNPEFDAIYNALKEYDEVHIKIVSQPDGTDLASSRAYAEIQKYIKKKYWDEKLVEAWKDLRLNVLRSPTAEENSGSMFYYSYYCLAEEPVNRLRYTQKEDYRLVFINSEGGLEVSADAARLRRLLEIPGVMERFEKCEYATSWKDGERIMSPVLFHNIYLGALGEESGLAILNKWGVQLQELPSSIYELFDFRINNDVYVDFKHHGGVLKSIDYEKELHHICDKLRTINERNRDDRARKVYIINVLHNGGEYQTIRTTHMDGFEIVEIPYLYDENNVRNGDAYLALVSEVNGGDDNENQ